MSPDSIFLTPASVIPRRSRPAVDVDAATGVINHIDVEPRVAAVYRRPGDAEIRAQPGHEDRVDPPLFQVAGEAGLRFLVSLEERRRMISSACGISMPLAIAAPSVPWTQ